MNRLLFVWKSIHMALLVNKTDLGSLEIFTMAAILNVLKDRELETVNKWLLEFACYSAFHDFVTKGSVDDLTNRNFIQGKCKSQNNSLFW